MRRTACLATLVALSFLTSFRAFAIPNGAVDDADRFVEIIKIVNRTATGTSYCSGVLIGPNVALTSGRCMGNNPVLGGVLVQQVFRDRKVSATAVSALYDGNASRGGAAYDFGMLVLDRSLEAEPLKVLPQTRTPDASEGMVESSFEPMGDGLHGIVVGFGSQAPCAERPDCKQNEYRSFKDVTVLKDAACIVPDARARPAYGAPPRKTGFLASTFCMADQVGPATFGDLGGALYLVDKSGERVLIGLLSNASDDIASPSGQVLERAASVQEGIGRMHRFYGAQADRYILSIPSYVP